MADNETIADVLAAMRDEAARADMEQGYSLDDAAEMMREFASRIDAAWKRERENYDAKIADLQLRVKLWTDRSDELVKKCVEQYAKLKQVGDSAKLREALIKAITMLAVCEWPDGTNMEGVEELRRDIDAALDAPPRNCDVGSVAEQKERFKDFCKEGKLSRIDLGAYCAYDCPCRDSYDCKLEWAQLPYEEGGAK